MDPVITRRLERRARKEEIRFGWKKQLLHPKINICRACCSGEEAVLLVKL